MTFQKKESLLVCYLPLLHDTRYNDLNFFFKIKLFHILFYKIRGFNQIYTVLLRDSKNFSVNESEPYPPQPTNQPNFFILFYLFPFNYFALFVILACTLGIETTYLYNFLSGIISLRTIQYWLVWAFFFFFFFFIWWR